jgi:hypothetical protein
MRQIRPTLTWWTFAVVALLVVVGISVPVGAAADRTARDKQPTAPPLVAPPAARSPVPPALVQVAELAENLYDTVKAAAWTKAASTLRSVERAVETLPGELRMAGADSSRLTSALGALNAAIPARNRTLALRAANEITLIAADLSEGYTLTVPPDVARLDYYGRAMEIWSAVGDMAKLADVARDIGRTWDALRPHVAARGGTAEIRTFDRLVARVNGARSPQAYGQIVLAFLEAVDRLESVFVR